MKRFASTEKWDSPWFRNLKPKYKTFLQFLWDKCDSAGVWIVDFSTAQHYVQDDLDSSDCLEKFGRHVIDLGSGKWLIPGFVDFQYGKLSPNCTPHKRIIECLSRHGLVIGPDGNTTLPGTLVDTLPSRVKEKDKEKEKEGRECEGNLFPVVFKDNARPENVDACRGYAVELKMPAEQGNAFFDFFSSNGWKVGGKAPMKDWRCAMRNWKRNSANFGTNKGNHQNGPYGKYL
jgi:hypothetical protein